jgi:hypothetical protein
VRRGSDYQGINNFLVSNIRLIERKITKGIFYKINKFGYFGGDMEDGKVGGNGQNTTPVITARMIMAIDTSYVT